MRTQPERQPGSSSASRRSQSSLGADQRFTTAVPGYTTSLQNRIEGSSTARAEIEKLNGSGGIGPRRSDAARLELPDFKGIKLWINTPDRPLLARQARGEGRARRLLDVLLHQLPAHASAPQGLGSRVPQGRAHDRRRPQSRVLVRTRSGQRAFSRAAPGRAVSGRTRQRLRDLARLLQRLLACGVPHRQVRARSLTSTTAKARTGRRRARSDGCSERRCRRAHVRRRRHAEPDHDARVVSRLCAPRPVRERRRAFDAEADYRFPERLAQDQLAYAGTLDGRGSRIVAGANARLRLRFQASDIYLVLAGSGQVRSIRRRTRGEDDCRVWDAAALHDRALSNPKRGLLELRFSPGVEGYAFTFG